MGYWLGFKGLLSYGLFIILTVVFITTCIPRTTASENVTSSFNAFSSYGVTTNISVNGYNRKRIGEICDADIDCRRQDRNSVCVTASDGHFRCQCANDFEIRPPTKYCVFIKDVDLGEACNFTGQCRDQYAECLKKVCVCIESYTKNNFSRCKAGYQRVNKNQEIYKAAMVALACFILAILGIFLLFVWNRSIQSRRSSQNAGLDPDRSDDIFSICDQLAIERLKSKPPTYEDVVLSDQQILGMPPPVYPGNQDESPSTSANRTRSFPSTSTATNTAGHDNPGFISEA